MEEPADMFLSLRQSLRVNPLAFGGFYSLL
jgi:hypothetical protein